jgi:hypothetical protein
MYSDIERKDERPVHVRHTPTEWLINRYEVYLDGISVGGWNVSNVGQFHVNQVSSERTFDADSAVYWIT